jgi:GNAT superfamily N-acetyltransferase
MLRFAWKWREIYLLVQELHRASVSRLDFDGRRLRQIIHMLPIRTLQPSDSLLELTDLIHRAYARLGAMGLNYTAVDQSPEVTAKRIEGGQCYVVEIDSKLAGTIVVKPTYRENECQYFTRPGVAAVHQFAVDPRVQGKGIGRALLQACEGWAQEHGFRELAMDTAEQAEHLIKLYARLGYNHVGFVQWSGKVYRSVVLSKPLR